MKFKRDLVPRPSNELTPNLTDQDLEDLAEVGRHVRAENTRRALESDWKLFEEYCATRNELTLPAKPAIVAAYITALSAGRIGGRLYDKNRKFFPRKLSTIKRHLASISVAHTSQGFPSPRVHPAVQDALKGIARSMDGTRSKKVGKEAFVIELLEKAVRSMPSGAERVRNQAVLSHGFHSGGRRRSEIVGTNIEDVRVTPEVTYVMLNRSKTDQSGQGLMTRIPRNGTATCPAAAIDALLAELRAHGFSSGPLYRKISDGVYVDERMPASEVALIVKEAAKQIGKTPEVFAAHSLRSGFITSAVQAGIDIFKIKRETGHKTTEALSGYVQDIVVNAKDLPSAQIISKMKKGR